MKKALSIFKKITDILSWVIIGVLVLSIVFSLIAKFNGSIPSAFGYTLCRVSSGSMEPELEVGDVILGKSNFDPASLKVGDVVTYKGSGELSGFFITHEVIVAPEMQDGVLMLQTKGTANLIPDSPISVDRVVSVVVCEVEFLNHFYNFFLSPWGLITIVFLIILVFIDEVIALIRGISGKPIKNNPERIEDIIDRVKSDTDTQSDDTENDNSD